MQDSISSWQQALRDSIDDVEILLSELQLPAELSATVDKQAGFKLKVPRSYVARMQAATPDDPLLRQVLPLQLEQHLHPEFQQDPVGDAVAEILPGLLHKYAGRVLLVTTGACAIHCRYCFRQHYPYAGAQPLRNPAVLAALQRDTSISEVILSGGDPLMFTDEMLSQFIQQLANIPHVQRVRLHTRLPIVLPARITSGLITGLITTRLLPVVVVHANHAQELDTSVKAAMQRLAEAGVTVLNQAVLLRGVNDTADALVALSEQLFACRILPYYLNILDKVQGAAHFAVSEADALALYADLQGALPGYLVPKLVKDMRGQAFKQLVT